MRIPLIMPAVRSTRRHVGAVTPTMAVAAAVLMGISLAGCATTKAAPIVAGPPLMVPEPPPRVLVPVADEPLASTAIGPDTPAAPAPQLRPTPPPRRSSTVRADADPRPEVQAPSAAVTPVQIGPEAPRDLRAATSPAELAADQQRIQRLLRQVGLDLKRAESLKLSVEGRKNLDEARRFADQAQEKLNERNIAWALSAAEKAATLAAALAGR